MLNNKGFTLVEVLTTISILAILMLVAVPNIVGVINNNKARVYVNDAKKLHSLAESLVHTDSDYKPLTVNECIKIPFSKLNNGEFDTPPNGGNYSDSFILVKRIVKRQTETNGAGHKVEVDVVDYEYYVYLAEKKGSVVSGISFMNIKNLYANSNVANKEPADFVEFSNLSFDTSSANCNL